LPLSLKLVEDGALSLNQMISKLTDAPSQILNLGKGTLEIGVGADVVIFDPDEEVTIDRGKFHSKSKNCPFHGWKLKGKVYYTIVNGKIVYSS